MNQRDIDLLEQNGWSVDCESPFVITHRESSSEATDIAADMVLGVIQRENDGKPTKKEYEEKIEALKIFLMKLSSIPTPERFEIITILEQSIENEYGR